MIFHNCISMIPSSVENKFYDLYEKCKGEAGGQTTTTPEPTTTEDPEEGSGYELSQSFIRV